MQNERKRGLRGWIDRVRCRRRNGGLALSIPGRGKFERNGPRAHLGPASGQAGHAHKARGAELAKPGKR
jgi:hypothetical protein